MTAPPDDQYWESAGVNLPIPLARAVRLRRARALGDMGDLIFWSSDGTQSGIYHVALYLGDGEMIEAPTFGARA